MASRGKLLVSLALQSEEHQTIALQNIPNQDVDSNVRDCSGFNDCCNNNNNGISALEREREVLSVSSPNVSEVELLEESHIAESPASESGINNAYDLHYAENSDDSIKDKDYQYESEEMSSDENFEEPEESVSNEETEEHIVEVTSKGRPKKGRKRKYEDQDRKTRKKKKNSNQTYHSAKGKLVKAKAFIDFHCSCQNDCNSKVSVNDKKEFFTHYWDLADYNVQTAFISTNVREEPIKRKTQAANPTKRQFSRIYKINKVAVCREMFIKTLGISTKRINTALLKARTLSIPDKRGLAGGHNKMTENQREAVIAHINKFPKYKSHYCRTKSGNQEFLPIGVTVTLMYKLYTEENENCVSLTAYRHIFLTEFNLKTKTPKKDTCNKCDSFQAQIQNASDEEKQRLTSEHANHLKEAEMARNAMNTDLAIAAVDGSRETLTFDMEKTPPLPRLSTNIIFYKRQLWLYNCGIYAGKHKKSFFHIWVEGQAGRGAQEVGSCLRKYIIANVDDTVRDLTLWSDSCGGQNRNIKMILILKGILEESDNNSLQSIRLRFLMSGHSFLPNDSDFGDVECALKRQQKLFSPQDYVKIMKTCRRKNPITVHAMKKEDFVTTKNIEKQITNRKKATTDEKINWLHMKEIKVIKEKPYSIFFKTKYCDEEDYQEINIKKGKGKLPEARSVFADSWEVLWPDGKPVAEAKLDDIKSYMHLIPAADHEFYTKLTGTAIDEDIEGFNGDLDFQLELDGQET